MITINYLLLQFFKERIHCRQLSRNVLHLNFLAVIHSDWCLCNLFALDLKNEIIHVVVIRLYIFFTAVGYLLPYLVKDVFSRSRPSE